MQVNLGLCELGCTFQIKPIQKKRPKTLPKKLPDVNLPTRCSHWETKSGVSLVVTKARSDGMEHRRRPSFDDARQQTLASAWNSVSHLGPLGDANVPAPNVPTMSPVYDLTNEITFWEQRMNPQLSSSTKQMFSEGEENFVGCAGNRPVMLKCHGAITQAFQCASALRDYEWLKTGLLAKL